MGGNQYRVDVDGVERDVDLDGFSIITDEDMDALEAAGIDEDHFMCPRDAGLADQDDLHFIAAVEYAANYSGFDVDQYIANSAE